MNREDEGGQSRRELCCSPACVACREGGLPLLCSPFSACALLLHAHARCCLLPQSEGQHHIRSEQRSLLLVP